MSARSTVVSTLSRIAAAATDAADRASSVHPAVERRALRLRDVYAYARIKWRASIAAADSAAPIDPFALYRVDPAEITRAMKPFDAPKWKLAGRTVGGDWDRRTRSFTRLDGKVDFAVYDSFAAHFDDGVPWEQTAFYERLLGEVRRGNWWWGCRSESDVRARCADLDRLYARIKREGYRSQQALAGDGSAVLGAARGTLVSRRIEGEIAVNVGRNGDLIFYDGRNRLAIAKLLGIDSIPVVILARHERWQRLRERLASGDLERSALPRALETHPDLIDIETATGREAPATER
ncbi:hypothetical protein ACNS7O_11290 [Haloferacaceae archaeon DSL9]